MKRRAFFAAFAAAPALLLVPKAAPAEPELKAIERVVVKEPCDHVFGTAPQCQCRCHLNAHQHCAFNEVP